MRVVVVSDSHQDFFSLQEVMKKHPKADLYLHLGDGLREWGQIQELYPERNFLQVRGNCDFSSDQPLEDCLSVGQAKIFYTHGYVYNVKYGIRDLIQAGKQRGANVILFGHTHIPLVDYQEGIHLMNPGSIGAPGSSGPTYGIVDVTPQGIVCFTNTLTY